MTRRNSKQREQIKDFRTPSIVLRSRRTASTLLWVGTPGGTPAFRVTAVLGRSSQKCARKWLIEKRPFFKFFFFVPNWNGKLARESAGIGRMEGVNHGWARITRMKWNREAGSPVLCQVGPAEGRELPSAGPIMAASSLVLKCQRTRRGVLAEIQNGPARHTLSSWSVCSNTDHLYRLDRSSQANF